MVRQLGLATKSLVTPAKKIVTSVSEETVVDTSSSSPGIVSSYTPAAITSVTAEKPITTSPTKKLAISGEVANKAIQPSRNALMVTSAIPNAAKRVMPQTTIDTYHHTTPYGAAFDVIVSPESVKTSGNAPWPWEYKAGTTAYDGEVLKYNLLNAGIQGYNDQLSIGLIEKYLQLVNHTGLYTYYTDEQIAKALASPDMQLVQQYAPLTSLVGTNTLAPEQATESFSSGTVVISKPIAIGDKSSATSIPAKSNRLVTKRRAASKSRRNYQPRYYESTEVRQSGI